MNKPHKHAALIHSWANGAEIQIKTPNGEWVDIDYTDWFEDNEYRIKPRTVTKVGWVNIHRPLLPNALQYAIIYRSEAAAIENARTHYLATVKVEWTEEVE